MASEFNAHTLSFKKRETQEPCRCGKRNCRHERFAWAMLATAHPHEAAEMNFARFVRYVRARAGRISTQDIRSNLDSTWAAYHDFELEAEAQK